MQLAIPLPQTPDGRVYRYSPNEIAHPRHFVLGNREAGFVVEEHKRERMRQEPGTTKTVCPYSGVIGDDGDFTHPKDQEAAIKIVKHAAMQDVESALSDMLKGVAQKSRGGITFKPGARTRRPNPQFGRRDLMRLLICDCCGRDYGVFAIALYCPDCGAPNIALHFGREVELVLQQARIAEDLGEDRQELAYRLLGNAHEDVLTAFEAVQKVVYVHRVSKEESGVVPAKPVRNDFQNVERAQKRYAEFGFNPFCALSEDERELLDLNAALDKGLMMQSHPEDPALTTFASREDMYRLIRLCMVKDERHFDKFDRAMSDYFEGVDSLDMDELLAKLTDVPKEWLDLKLDPKNLTEEQRRLLKKYGSLEELMKALE
ncbi:hypothetical protein LCGC14_1337160, partial [marine sediment metagenome]